MTVHEHDELIRQAEEALAEGEDALNAWGAKLTTDERKVVADWLVAQGRPVAEVFQQIDVDID